MTDQATIKAMFLFVYSQYWHPWQGGSTYGTTEVNIAVRPLNLKSENFRKHLFPDPLGQILPHGTQAIMLPDVEQERERHESQKDECIDPCFVFDLLMIRQVVDKERTTQAISIHRLDDPRNDGA